MKKLFFIFAFICLAGIAYNPTQAQCAMCTKTAAQLGEKPAKGLNAGILYLLATPFAIVGIIGFRWWKNQKKNEAA